MGRLSSDRKYAPQLRGYRIIFPIQNQFFLPNTNQSDTTRFTMAILSIIVVAIAKLLMPGKDPGGFIVTILLGIAGALIATYIGQAVGWYKAGDKAGWIMSVI